MNAKPYDFTKPAPLSAAAAGSADEAGVGSAHCVHEQDRGPSNCRCDWKRCCGNGTGCTRGKQLPQLPEPCLAYRVVMADGKIADAAGRCRASLMLNLVGALLGDDADGDSRRSRTDACRGGAGGLFPGRILAFRLSRNLADRSRGLLGARRAGNQSGPQPHLRRGRDCASIQLADFAGPGAMPTAFGFSRRKA